MNFRTLALLFALFLASRDARAQWAHTNLPATEIDALAVIGANVFAGTTGSGAFRSIDNGANWSAIGTGVITDTVISLGVNGSILFAGTYSAGVFRSSDNGDNWTSASKGLTNRRISGLLVHGTDLFASTWGSGVLRSTDSGATWIAVNSGLPSPVYINAIAYAGKILFAGCNGKGVFRSSDDGATWGDASSGLTSNYVDCIASIDTSLFAGTFGYGVCRSSDSGSKWSAATSGISFPNVLSFLPIGSNLFAGTLHGAFLSTDRGTKWTATGGPFQDAFISMVSTGSDLFAGTLDSGLWHRPLAQMIQGSGVHSEVSYQPLGENFPNPFTLRTTIPFTLPRAGHISLKIFNTLGQEIATLADQNFDAGPHEVEWYASNKTPGIYFCRVATADGVQTRAMILESPR